MSFYKRNGKKEAIQFANNFLNIIILISFTLTVLGMVFASGVIKLIAPNLDASTAILTTQLIRILFPIMLFTAVAYVFVGFLQSLEEFKIPAIISVVANGILILYLIIFNDKFGIQGVAIAMLVGWGTQILVQLPTVIKKGFQYHFTLNFKEEGMLKVVKLALPILISTWVQPINNIVNRRLASGLEEGQAMSALDYSYDLYLIIVGVFSYTLSNIIFPELSKLTADNNKESLKELLNRSIKISTLFIIPMSVGIALLSNEIVKVIYERGEFTEHSTILTGGALFFYAFGMIGYGLMEILNKAFYAMQDSKTPMYLSGFSIILNVILSVVLVKVMGYTGLPLAASITSITTAGVMLYIVNRKNPGVLEKKVFVELAKIIVSAVVMGIVVLLVKRIFTGSTLMSLLVSIMFGIVAYFLCVFLLKSETVQMGIQIFKDRKLKKANKVK
ncbi:MAG: murein biosynthesis integral membrane protein MurJ [Clostridia bacterium]|nr:murein biosynthesis integral membrane protein MurJ [Clostridia bacterium]